MLELFGGAIYAAARARLGCIATVAIHWNSNIRDMTTQQQIKFLLMLGLFGRAIYVSNSTRSKAPMTLVNRLGNGIKLNSSTDFKIW
jgi:hypothetical protein